MNRRLIRFYDTTLRDGEQMPQVAFDASRRGEIARALDAAGVDEIEIGFAASGREQRKDMAAVVALGLTARLLSLARPLREDVDLALETGVDGLILFCSASPIHLRYKLASRYEKVRQRTMEAVAYAAASGLRVQLSLEDATRTPLGRLQELARLAVEHGAHRVGLADTVGIATPASIAELVRGIVGVVEIPVAVHCHDDFGLGVANSLAAVEAGATVLSTTINGIGERSGNTSTEQCAVALEHLYGYRTNIDLRRLPALCDLVAECAGIPIAPNRPIVGRNSFRHESGIHVAAVLREPSCYEPIDPELVGRRRELVLGKTSGRAALRHFAGERGGELSDECCQRILARVKSLAEAGATLDSVCLDRLIDEERGAAISEGPEAPRPVAGRSTRSSSPGPRGDGGSSPPRRGGRARRTAGCRGSS